MREFTYPVGLGTFDPYAYPPRAIITRVEHVGNRISIAADVEIAVKAAARPPHRPRVAQARDAARDAADPAEARYVLVGADGKVVGSRAAPAGKADGRFAVPLPPDLPPGSYTALRGYLSRRQHDQSDIGRIDFRSELRQCEVEIRGCRSSREEIGTPQSA